MSAPATGTSALRILRRVAEALPRERSQPLETADKTDLNARLMRLVVLARAIVAAGGLAVAWAMHVHSAVQVPLVPMALVLLALAVLSAMGLARVRAGSGSDETDLLLQFACDIAILTVVLAAAAGRKSPFELLFVLPVMLGAFAFSGWRMALLAILAAAGWTTVHQLEGTTPAYPAAIEMPAHAAVGAMLAYFGFALARLSQRHQRNVCGQRERALTALGAEASGRVAVDAAQALGTPLGTMAVIVADLREDRIAPAERAEALETLASQIAACKLHLSGLLASAGVERGEHGYRANVLRVVEQMRDECLLCYPAGRVRVVRTQCPAEAPDVVIELSLFNALAGMLKDLAREAPHVAVIAVGWDEQGVLLTLGPGYMSGGPAASSARRRERLAVLTAIVARHGGARRLDSTGAVMLRLPTADQSEPAH